MATGATRAVTGTARMQDKGPAWSADSSTIAYVSERSGWYELHLVDATSGEDQQLTHDEAEFGDLEWHPDGGRILATRTRRGHRDLVTVDATSGAVTQLAPGGVWQLPHWLADGSAVATYEDHTTAPRIERLDAKQGYHREVLFAPTLAAVVSIPHVTPEEVTYRSFDGLEIHGFLFRPAGASAGAPVAAVVYPHGGPTDASADEWDGLAQYFVDRGYAWFAPNFRGSTGYGRDFERKNHAVWGVDDTRTVSRPTTISPRSAGSTRSASRSSAGRTARTWRSPPPPTIPSTGSRRRCASTATATSRHRGRWATVTAARTWSG